MDVVGVAGGREGSPPPADGAVYGDRVRATIRERAAPVRRSPRLLAGATDDPGGPGLDGGDAVTDHHVDGPPREHAQFIVAALEGAMMLARSHGAERRFQTAARRLLADMGI